MACVRFRRGKWVVDWRDQWGKRRWLTFPGTDDGKVAAETEKERLDRGVSDAGITLGDYIDRSWLPLIRKRLEPLSYRSYEAFSRNHIPGPMKRRRIASITRAELKRFLASVGTDHSLSDSSVAQVANVLRSIFESALDDELVAANPAAGLRLSLGIVAHRAENVRAMDATQLDAFLATAQVKAADEYLALAMLAYTGIRIGEMRGLQLTDLDFENRGILIERQVYEDGRVGPVKGRRGKKRPRVVGMADKLREALEPALVARRTYAMRTGQRGPWLLYPDWPAPVLRDGVPYVPVSVYAIGHQIRYAMARVLKLARLPDHFTPHCLRHTFARVLLERGEKLEYVSQQLGHASLALTWDRYGHWARLKPQAGGANLLSGRGE